MSCCAYSVHDIDVQTLLSFYLPTSCRLHTHTHSLSLSHTYSLSHTHTRTHTHTLSLSQTHTHALTHPHSLYQIHTLSLLHTLPLSRPQMCSETPSPHRPRRNSWRKLLQTHKVILLLFRRFHFSSFSLHIVTSAVRCDVWMCDVRTGNEVIYSPCCGIHYVCNRTKSIVHSESIYVDIWKRYLRVIMIIS